MTDLFKFDQVTFLKYFRQLNSLPRASGSDAQICVAQYLLYWAKEHHFTYRKDSCGNILIIAGEGVGIQKQHMRVPLILQAHMDMVYTKSSNSTHRYGQDPIEVIVYEIEGQMSICARDTSLGADNGVGLVTMLMLAETICVSASAPVPFPISLLLLFTVNEEIGLVGADLIDPCPFLPEKAYLINVDNDTEHSICCGSSGGSVVVIL